MDNQSSLESILINFINYSAFISTIQHQRVAARNVYLGKSEVAAAFTHPNRVYGRLDRSSTKSSCQLMVTSVNVASFSISIKLLNQLIPFHALSGTDVSQNFKYIKFEFQICFSLIILNRCILWNGINLLSIEGQSVYGNLM